MKKIKEILYKVPIEGVLGSTSRLVTDIALDSRDVIKNGMFVAINGSERDGHDILIKHWHQGQVLSFVSNYPKNLIKRLFMFK